MVAIEADVERARFTTRVQDRLIMYSLVDRNPPFSIRAAFAFVCSRRDSTGFDGIRDRETHFLSLVHKSVNVARATLAS